MQIEPEKSIKNYETFVPLLNIKDQLRIVNNIYDETLKRIRTQVIDLVESFLSVDVCSQSRFYLAEKIKSGISTRVLVPENHKIKVVYFSDDKNKESGCEESEKEFKHDDKIAIISNNEIQLEAAEESSVLKYIVCKTEFDGNHFKIFSLKSTILEHIECIYEKKSIESATQFYLRFYQAHKEFNI